MSEASQSAVAAALSVARAEGLRCDDPVVLRGFVHRRAARVRRHADRGHTDVIRSVISRRPDLEGQALHGDAHLDNCLGTPNGALWHDFETACRGPREYDLAALMSRDRVFGEYQPAREALAAYGAHDQALVDALLPLYVAWVTASMLTA